MKMFSAECLIYKKKQRTNSVFMWNKTGSNGEMGVPCFPQGPGSPLKDPWRAPVLLLTTLGCHTWTVSPTREHSALHRLDWCSFLNRSLQHWFLREFKVHIYTHAYMHTYICNLWRTAVLRWGFSQHGSVSQRSIEKEKRKRKKQPGGRTGARWWLAERGGGSY